MKSISQELIALQKEMQEHTFSHCLQTCDKIAQCCTQRYCLRTKDYAESVGVALEPTGHPTLLFMGEAGCTVPPHLRPECTRFMCKDVPDKAWTVRYYALRREILFAEKRTRKVNDVR